MGAKEILRKNKAGSVMTSDFILQSYSNKTECYSYKSRYINQWNRIEKAAINSSLNGQLIYNERGKNI